MANIRYDAIGYRLQAHIIIRCVAIGKSRRFIYRIVRMRMEWTLSSLLSLWA